MTLLMLKGLPASGKTTYAKQLVKEGWVRVNKDDLRAMLHDGKHTKGNESQVIAIRDSVITDALSRGRSVVVDDTNFNPEHELRLREIAETFKARFEIDDSFTRTSVSECIKRDLARPNSVGEKAIWQMYDKYLKPPEKKIEYKLNFDLPAAIVCDIDGTLAHKGDRSPYDWSRVGEDTVDYAMRDILYHYAAMRDPQDEQHATTIVLFSGRDEVCRPETEKWLADNNVKYDYLYMRPEGDGRKDYIVKKEMFKQHINGRYNVLFMLDDRNQVVTMWRSMGIKCLQVERGDF